MDYKVKNIYILLKYTKWVWYRSFNRCGFALFLWLADCKFFNTKSQKATVEFYSRFQTQYRRKLCRSAEYLQFVFQF